MLELESIETHSMSSNLVHLDNRRPKEPMAGIDLLGNPTIQLLYEYTNNAGGHVYLHHKNDYVVRISEGKEPVAPHRMLKLPTMEITTWKLQLKAM